MKELEQYLGATCSYSCQSFIMIKTRTTFPDPEMHTITYLGTKRPNTDAEMTYLKKNNNDESIDPNLRKKDVYKSDMHKIYNLVVCQISENYKRRQRWTPPSRRSRLTETQ